MTITKPKFTYNAGIYTFEWSEEQIAIKIDRVSENAHNTTGEIIVTSTNSDTTSHLHQAKLNLTSTSSRKTLANHLSSRLNIDWDGILEQACILTLQKYREGEPTEEIWPSEDDDLSPSYALEPILYLNHPTVIFGDYGSLKSLIALATAYIVQLPYHDNTLGLITAKQPIRCLFLDYEDDPSSFRRRWSALERGFGKGAMPILYRRMTSTLSDSVERLQQIIHDGNIGLIIVDSLGPAARGNLNDPEPAIKYHTALRQLGISSLTLAHNAKDLLTKRRTIFGSVFFTNLARSVWECKAAQETGEDEAVISLKHTKANLSKLHPPLGYRFSFTDNTINIAKTDLRDTGLSGELPLSMRIKDLLRGGSMPTKEISEALDANEATTRTALNRMFNKDQLVKMGDLWGLRLET